MCQLGCDLVTLIIQPLQAIFCARRNVPWMIQNLHSEQTNCYYYYAVNTVSNTCIVISVDSIFMNIFFVVGSFLVRLLFSLRRIPHDDELCFCCIWRPHKRADVVNCRWTQLLVCKACQVTVNWQEQTTFSHLVGNTTRIHVFWPFAQSSFVFKNIAWRKDHWM